LGNGTKYVLSELEKERKKFTKPWKRAWTGMQVSGEKQKRRRGGVKGFRYHRPIRGIR